MTDIPIAGRADGGDPLTGEDISRARDRLAVAKARDNTHAKKPWQWMRLLWLLAGPGVLVFLGENDAPSMLSYAATGSSFGIGFFLPFIGVTFLAGWIVQEMTVRLGSVTHRGHAELIFDRFGPFWGFFSMADLMLGNFLTLITEFIGIRAGLGYFGVPALVAVGAAITLILAVTMTRRYWTWERILLGLALFNGLFIPVALMTHPNWGAVGHAFLTWSPLPGGLNANNIMLMMADIGATVTPWMLFFQQGATTDKGMQPKDVGFGRWDTSIGTLLATIFGIAVVLATVPLYTHGISTENFKGAQFAQALQPYVGKLGSSLFALGLVEAGLVAAISISTSSAYAFGEVMHHAHSLNRSVKEAWPFYLILLGSAISAGAIVLIPQAPLEFIVLIVNVIAVLAMPPALLFLLLLVNDREVMGDRGNGLWLNIAGIGVTVFLILAGLGYGVTTVFPKLLG
ncbi:MAG: NRAMP family divalent metal transporter [Phycisphaerae bacterium]